MSEKFEIKNINDLLDVFENTDGYYLGDYTCFQIANYIRKMYNQLKLKENIIKEVREYIESHAVFFEDGITYFVKAVPSELLNILDKEEEELLVELDHYFTILEITNKYLEEAKDEVNK